MKSTCYLTKILLTTLLILLISPIASQSGEIKTINRPLEFYQVKGKSISAFSNQDIPVGQLYLYAYRAATDQWEPIPFQIDELYLYLGATDTITYYFELDTTYYNYTLLHEPDENLNHWDELVFMVKDAGDEAETDNWIEDLSAQQFPRYQIMLKDNFNGDTKGWVYLYRSTNNLTKSPVSYVDYDSVEDKIITNNYEVGHDSEGVLIDFIIKQEGGGNGKDILDRNRFRYSGSLFGLPYEWTDSSLVKDTDTERTPHPLEYKKGPIRVIRLLHSVLKVGAYGSFPVPFTSWYYPHFYRFSKKVPIDELLKTELVRFSFNLNENAIPMSFFSSDSSGENSNQNIPIDGAGETDGITDSLSRNKPFWTMVTGDPGTILTINDVEYLGGESYSFRLYYYDKADAEEPSIGDHGVVITSYKLKDEIRSLNNIYLLRANFPADSALVLFNNFNNRLGGYLTLQTQTAVNESATSGVPDKFKLYPSYPNPFNAATKISFDLPQRENTVVQIFNIRGKLVITLLAKTLNAGHHHLLWDGKNSNGENAGTGVYLIRIHSGHHYASTKTVMLK